MQVPHDIESERFTITRHALRPGEHERQVELFRHNAALTARFGDNHRGAYAAMVSTTAIASGVELTGISGTDAKGWWARPADAMTDRAILFIHGGGYHLGDAAAYRGLTSQIAARTCTAVFSMDYPLAPEHRFPAAHDAAVSTLEWLLRHNIKQVAIMGDSAGGGLALALLAEATPKGRLASVVVFSPWTDLALAGPSFNDRDMRDPVFEPEVLTRLAASYLDGVAPQDRRASPLYGVPVDPPPIAIQVGSEELLLDDSRRYAHRVAQCGHVVALDIFEGMHHVFQHDAGTLETADMALDMAGQFVTKHWN